MIELYIIEAAAFSPYREKALEYVSPARREKALRIRSESELLRSLSGGVLLHTLLGEAEPLLSPEGKPYLPGGPAFSLSHGGLFTVLAVDRSGENPSLGVDVEPGDRPWRQNVAERMFRGEELRFLAEGGPERFFYLWTRKEALLKCMGQGLRFPMWDFSVLEDRCTIGDTAYLLSTRETEGHCLSLAAPRSVQAQLIRLGVADCLPTVK